MAQRTWLSLPVTLALALSIASCNQGGTKSNPTTSASNTAAPSASTSRSTGTSNVSACQNVITPETAKKGPLRLKAGDCATFQREGVTVTVTPGTVEKFNGAPRGIEDKTGDNDCGLWLALPVHVVIDVEPTATWTGWYMHIIYPYGLYSEEKHPLQHPGTWVYSDAATPGVTTEPDDIGGNTVKEGTGKDWQPGKALHWEYDGKQYLTACKESPEYSGHYVPNDQPLIGYAWGYTPIEEYQHRENTPELAVWIL